MTADAPALLLRPRGMGELLDQAVRLYRANFLKFIGIIALVEIPVGLLQMIVSVFALNGITNMSATMQTSPETLPSLDSVLGLLGGMGGSMLVSALSFLLVNGIGTAALTRAIADGYLGEPVGILDSYSKIGKHWGSLVGALVFFMLLEMAAMIWFIIPCVGWLTGFGLMMFLSVAVLPLVGPIVVLEKAKAVAAVRRAWDLARARFWWLVGYAGILFLFNLLIISGPVTILNSLLVSPLQKEALATGASQSYLLATVAEQGLSMLLSILYLSLQSVAFTLAYFDLRIRLEGLDLAVQTLSPDQSIVEQLTQAPTAQGLSKMITSKDALNFLLLSLIVAVIYATLLGIMMMIGLGTGGLGGLS